MQSSTEISLHSETKFRAQFDDYALWVTVQESGKHFGTLKQGASYLDTYTGVWDSQSEAIAYLLAAMGREISAQASPVLEIFADDVILPDNLHTTEEIIAAAMNDEAIYRIFQSINRIITHPDNWKLPVRIKNIGFPVAWIEATTIFFSGCAMNEGLWRAGDWNYLYCEGYYARIGA